LTSKEPGGRLNPEYRHRRSQARQQCRCLWRV